MSRPNNKVIFDLNSNNRWGGLHDYWVTFYDNNLRCNLTYNKCINEHIPFNCPRRASLNTNPFTKPIRSPNYYARQEALLNWVYRYNQFVDEI